MTPKYKFLATARSLVGTRWLHGGRSSRGIDCIGLVLCSARAAGVSVPEPDPYPPEPQDARLFQELGRYGKIVREPEPADVLLFRTSVYGGHLGIYAMHPQYGVPSLVHALLRRRRVVEEPYTVEHSSMLIAAFRLEIF